MNIRHILVLIVTNGNYVENSIKMRVFHQFLNSTGQQQTELRYNIIKLSICKESITYRHEPCMNVYCTSIPVLFIVGSFWPLRLRKVITTFMLREGYEETSSWKSMSLPS